MTPELQASYRACGQLARRSASNFYYPLWLLPPAKRRAMYALYAFSRRIDDLGDGPQPLEEKQRALTQARASLRQALAGQFDHPHLPALVDTVERHQIPPACFESLLDGVEMDLKPRGYETFDHLLIYCDRVASAVGWACIHVWGCSDNRVWPLATSCGRAFQMTNILRDLAEDAQRGRVYLPRADLRRFGYTTTDLRGLVHDERLAPLVRFEAARTRELYDHAAPLGEFLHRDGRRVFQAMFRVYRQLLAEIERRPEDIFRRRIRLTAWQKGWIAACTLLPLATV